MPKQLLDAAQVRPAVQQMRGEAVAQRMRRRALADADARGPCAQPPAHVAGAQRPPGLAQEQHIRRIGPCSARERRTSPLQVEPHRRHRRLSHRHQPRLAPLSLHPQLLSVVVHVRPAQRHDLLGSQPARICQLEHRAVAQVQWTRRRDAFEQPGGLTRTQHTRKMGGSSRRGHQVGRVLGDPPVLALACEQRAQRRQLAGRGARGGGPAVRRAFGEVGDVTAHVLWAQLLRRQATADGPPRELSEIDRVRAARALGGVAPSQVLAQQRDRLRPGAAQRRSPFGRELIRLDSHLELYFAAAGAPPSWLGFKRAARRTGVRHRPLPNRRLVCTARSTAERGGCSETSSETR